MSSSKKLLISLITVAATSAFADSMSTATSSGESGLEPLSKADLQYRSDSQSDAVVAAEEREGVYIGSGDGTVIGDRYEWLTKVLAVMEGEFDEKTGRAIWNVYIPARTP